MAPQFSITHLNSSEGRERKAACRENERQKRAKKVNMIVSESHRAGRSKTTVNFVVHEF